MRTGGILLIAAGGILIYWVLRAGLKSERSSSGSSSSSGGGGGGTKYSVDTVDANGNPIAAGGDIGTHSAIDTTGTETGTVGDVYTVNSTYGDASGQQQDDMNAFAHAMGG